MPVAWLIAVIEHESARFPCGRSPKGAMGLMQLMPTTWATLRAQLSLGPSAFDVADNVLAGATYLRQLYDRFGPTGMLGAYSAGPGRYMEAVSAGRPLPAETTAYIAALAPRLRGGDVVHAAFGPPSNSLFARVFAGEASGEAHSDRVSDADAESLFVQVDAPGGAP